MAALNSIKDIIRLWSSITVSFLVPPFFLPFMECQPDVFKNGTITISCNLRK
jgi:hypothetical protein